MENKLMEIDNQFRKNLKEIDDKLDVGWNNIKKRWQIISNRARVKSQGFLDGKRLMTCFNRPSLVFTVENEDGSFRPLDGRVFEHLREIDLNRYPRISDFWRKIEQEEADYKERQSRQQSEYIQELTKDNYHRIQDAIEADSYGRFGGN